MISATAPRSASQATLITGLLGSGKTWSLTNQFLQAARADTSTTCDPQQGGTLLALSRQDNAAALRQKVDLDRPLGCAICDVTTFPSLVRTIVNDFGPTVGSYTPADVRVLDRSSLCVFLHRHLDTLPLGKFRPLHDPGNAVRPILHLFSSLAHCGIAPEDYLRYVETLETELEQTVAVEPPLEDTGLLAKKRGPEGARVGPSRAQLRAQLEGEAWREHVAGERDKANSYEAFVALKRREGIADHSDHLLLARRILKESASARTALSLRLSHIFVDDLHEYSPAMLDILAGLAAPGVGITATADPLLAARSAGVARGHALGAEHMAVPRFKKAFPGTVEVRLAGNRPSTDAIRVSMEALEPRDAPVVAKNTKKKEKKEMGAKAVESKVVVAATDTAAVAEPISAPLNETPTDSPATEGSSRLSCLAFRTEDEELKALGRKVRELTDGGVRPSDIGVAAVGGWGTADVLSAALSANGVPVEGGTRFSSVFDSETPRMLMSFLRCLVHPSESTPLLHLLMNCPAYALPDGELTAALEGHLSRYVPLRSFLRDHLLFGEGGGAGPRGGGGVSADVTRVAGKILSDVDRFGEGARKKGVRKVMMDFLRYTGQLELLEEPSTAEEEREGRAVAELFELAVMAEKQAGGDNVALVEPVLRLFRRHGVGYTEEDSSSYFENREATDPEGSSGGGVTVFEPGKDGAAAGRSFHTVFIPFCTRTRLPGNLRKARLPVPGPFLGAPEPRDAGSIRSEADLTRVCHENRARAKLYAAVASARKDVFLSVSARVSRGKTHLTPSPFLSDILGASAPQEWKEAAPKEDSVGVADAASGRVEVSPLDTTGGKGEGVGETRSLRLSFSSISSLAACPHSYYLQHVLNVSPPPNPRMVYGRAMHEAVASFLTGTVGGGGGGGGGSGGGGPPPTLETAVKEFKQHFNGCAFESSAQVKTLTENGVIGLASFLSRLLEGGASAAPVGVEGGVGLGEGAAPSKLDLRPQLLVERKFMVKVPEAGVVLTGIFDRVDVAPTSAGGALGPPLVSITDYKSNVGAKDPSRMVQDNLQLRLYSLAAERLFGVMPAEAVIESIEDGRRGVAVPSQADAELALEAISVTAAAVRAEKFDATPSFQACTFCGFKHMCRHSLAPNSVL